MRRVERFLIRLYPANWRARYGEEFAALVEDSSPGWSALVDLLKGALKMQLSVPAFPKLAAMLSISGLLAGLAFSFLVTPRFVSVAVMQFIPPMVTSNPPDEHRNLNEFFLQLRAQILSRTSLKNIIEDPRLELYRREREKEPLEDVIEKMRQDILVTQDAPAGATGDYLPFHITFAYNDRVKAQQTVQALMRRFQDANLITQRNQARVKRAVTSDQIYRLEERIAALEKRLGVASAAHEPDYTVNSVIPPFAAGINLDVVDPPNLPVRAAKPNREVFMFFGFAAGMVLALFIAIFLRRPPPIPFPAQTA